VAHNLIYQKSKHVRGGQSKVIQFIHNIDTAMILDATISDFTL
jgi:hypothetical protein